MKTCQIHKLLPLKCGLPPDESDRHGLCLMHSRNPHKNRDAFQASIKEKIKSNDYNFQGYFFPIIAFNENIFYNANFSHAIFFNYVSFEKAIFNGNTVFTCSVFLDDVNYSKVIFNGHTDFRFVTFSEAADFSFTRYNRSALFLVANFLGYSRFWFSIFNGEVKYEYVSFMGFTTFRGIKIEKQLTFSWINHNLNPNDFNADFSILDIHNQGSLRFEHSYMGGIRFEDTDLRIPQFYHVTWQTFWWRNIIHDEMELRERESDKISKVLMETSYLADMCIDKNTLKSPQYPYTCQFGHVEKLYRELKINYENQQDYKNAGDFHYGEMEMQRCDSKWRWFPTWYNLYRLLSGYGERPSWALCWLAVFLAIFTSLLAWTGLEILDPKHSGGFGNSFFYLLQKVTLQRPTWAEPQGFWGKLVAGFSVLLIPGQAALFLLALRNRLGRRR